MWGACVRVRGGGGGEPQQENGPTTYNVPPVRVVSGVAAGLVREGRGVGVHILLADAAVRCGGLTGWPGTAGAMAASPARYDVRDGEGLGLGLGLG